MFYYPIKMIACFICIARYTMHRTKGVQVTIKPIIPAGCSYLQYYEQSRPQSCKNQSAFRFFVLQWSPHTTSKVPALTSCVDHRMLLSVGQQDIKSDLRVKKRTYWTPNHPKNGHLIVYSCLPVSYSDFWFLSLKTLRKRILTCTQPTLPRYNGILGNIYFFPLQM